MAVGDVGASSFEFYEGIRILVPGAVAVAVYGAVVETFAVEAPEPAASALGALVAALLIGLLVYFVDLPARTRVYKAALPHTALDSWSAAERGGASATNLYFILLDERIPPGIRSRALYMGSIFRIGFESIYMLAVAAAAVLVLARLGVGDGSGDAHGTEAVLWISAGIQILCPVTMIAFALKDTSALGRQLRQLKTWRVVPAVLGLVAVVTCLLVGTPPWLGALGIGCLLATWAVLYVVGVPPHGGRANLAALPATVLLALPGAAAAAFCAAELPPRGVLGPGAASGWALASLAALLMVAVRGHERRWFGAYYTQLAWIRLREAELKAEYGT